MVTREDRGSLMVLLRPDPMPGREEQPVQCPLSKVALNFIDFLLTCGIPMAQQ